MHFLIEKKVHVHSSQIGEISDRDTGQNVFPLKRKALTGGFKLLISANSEHERLCYQ